MNPRENRNRNRDGTWVDMRAPRQAPARPVTVPSREPIRQLYVISQPKPVEPAATIVSKPEKVKRKKHFRFNLRPVLRLVKRIRTLPRKKQVLLIGIIVLVIVLLSIIHLIVSSHNKKIVANQQPVVAKLLTDQSPSFTTILPAGKSIKSLGGWTRISPSTANAVYAYIDSIGSASFSVSEQPLPDSFKADPNGSTQALATSFKDTGKITVGTTTVYIGDSSKGGQSVIFTENNLLILINANSIIDNTTWAQYINTLQ